MSIVLQVKDKVQRLLAEYYNSVQLTSSGGMQVWFDDQRVIITVGPFRETSAIIEILAITNYEVPESPDLFKYIATQANGFRFGALSLYDNKNGTYNVNFAHAILGDNLDPEELRAAVGAVAWTANDIDQTVKERFGGKLPRDP